MRTVSSVRWAGSTLVLALALAISIVPASAVPASADRAHRDIAACASFDQVGRGDDRVAFTIRNACSIPVDCAVSWRVVCAPDAKKRRASHPGSARLAIPEGASLSAEASAAICGDDAWVIDAVVWSCQPNKD
jgi:putative hemolysin